MPYAIEMLLRKVEEPCVREWLEQLNPNTVNYGYYFLGFFNWFRQNGIWRLHNHPGEEYHRDCPACNP